MSNPTLDKDALEAAARAASPGKWVWSGLQLLAGLQHHSTPVLIAEGEPWTPDQVDRDYITAAQPETILSLLAEIKGLREALEPFAKVHEAPKQLADNRAVMIQVLVRNDATIRNLSRDKVHWLCLSVDGVTVGDLRRARAALSQVKP